MSKRRSKARSDEPLRPLDEEGIPWIYHRPRLDSAAGSDDSDDLIAQLKKALAAFIIMLGELIRERYQQKITTSHRRDIARIPAN